MYLEVILNECYGGHTLNVKEGGCSMAPVDRQDLARSISSPITLTLTTISHLNQGTHGIGYCPGVHSDANSLYDEGDYSRSNFLLGQSIQ